MQVASIGEFAPSPSTVREPGKTALLPSDNVKDDAMALGVCRVPSRDDYVKLLQAHAKQNALPPVIAEAVTYIESRFHPDKIGKVGEVGLMQIRPATAAMLGFRGSFIELAEPATNVKYGVAYLARAWRLADGNLCRALTKYRAGHRAERMSLLSKKYCSLAKDYLRQSSSPQSVTASSGAIDSPSLISSR
jgi:soluble lytic murein transglycosylase-like protein